MKFFKCDFLEIISNEIFPSGNEILSRGNEILSRGNEIEIFSLLLPRLRTCSYETLVDNYGCSTLLNWPVEPFESFSCMMGINPKGLKKQNKKQKQNKTKQKQNKNKKTFGLTLTLW